MIPKNLIQTYHGDLPFHISDQMESFLSPEWEYKIFNEESMNEYIQASATPEFINAFHTLANGKKKSIWFRFYWIFLEGGVYLDSDILPSQPLDSFIQNNSIILVQDTNPNFYRIQMFAAEKNHPLMKQMVQILLHDDPLDPLWIHKQWSHLIQTNIPTSTSILILKENYPDYSKNYRSEFTNDQTCYAYYYWKDKTIPQKEDSISIFTNIYEKCIWGNENMNGFQGSSGEGSSIDYNKNSYVPFLRKFIQDHSIQKVVDLGCGDFRCGELIYGDLKNIQYYGFDAYKKLIQTHKKTYQNHPRFHFAQLNFSEQVEKLPPADLCILKDVIQHWPLDLIYQFMDKLVSSKKFKYIMICNCAQDAIDNSNITTGDWRPISANKFPLKKYNPSIIYTYRTKEVSIIHSTFSS